MAAFSSTAAPTATAFASGYLSPSPRRTSPSRSFAAALARGVAARRRGAGVPAAARSTVSVRAEAGRSKRVLIVNTNGGGHAVIGFYFAKELLAAGHAVTVLTVGDEASDKMKKPPFSRFSVH